MVLCFGGCELDRRARVLTRDGREQHLSNKAYELLGVLLDARPDVVTKQTLMDKLWPEAFVSEANLPVHVREARQAIGDVAKPSTLIRTHSGVGYSFVGQVTEFVGRRGFASRQAWPMLTIGSRRVVLGEGATTIGRDAQCTLCLQHPSVSRIHARIVVDGPNASIEDAGSKNGVQVNGRRARGRIPLQAGVALRIGAVEATFTIEEGSAGSTWSMRD